jgi:hypothetical protein
MMRWQDVRFGSDTRIELRSGVTVRPLSLGFRFRESGDEGPAGIFVCAALGQTIPNTDPDEVMRGEEAVREVWLGEVVAIHAPAAPVGRRS